MVTRQISALLQVSSCSELCLTVSSSRLAVLLAFLSYPANPAPCFPGAIFPKLIGTGLSGDTFVTSVDRRDTDGFLALAVLTTDPRLVGKLTPALSGIWTVYDPATNVYKWLKVVYDIQHQKANTQVRFSPDGSKVLAFFYATSSSFHTFIYFDASTGNPMASKQFQKIDVVGQIKARDQLVMNYNGSKIFYIRKRILIPNAYASLVGISFDSSASPPWANYGYVTWDAVYLNSNLQQFSLALFPDPSPTPSPSFLATHLITFSSYLTGARYGQMYVWNVSGGTLNTSPVLKLKSSNTDFNCRHPFIRVVSAQYEIYVLTEYYMDQNKSGFLKIVLSTNFLSWSSTEKTFTSPTASKRDLSFKSAFYKELTVDSVAQVVAFAMAVNTLDGSNYLMRYEFDRANNRPYLWQLKGLSEDPNATSFAGDPHLGSIIYGTQTVSNDFDVLGWIVGGKKTVWAYDDCLAPDFGITTVSYKKLVETTSMTGYVSKIDLDVQSCNHEQVSKIDDTTGAAATNFITAGSFTPNNLNLFSENSYEVVVSIYDLPAASDPSISAGDWESSLNLAACAAASADEKYYDFVKAIFDGDDFVQYSIGLGPVTVDFTSTPWYVSGNTCEANFLYQAIITPSSVTSPDSDMTITQPTDANKKIVINANEVAIHGVDHQVTVLVKTPSFQCQQKSFTVLPSDCSNTSITGAFWTSTINLLNQVEYTIKDAANVQTFKWVSQITQCPFEVKIEEETALGSGVWNAYSGSEVTIALDANPAPGQHVYKATIYTTNESLDPGGGSAPTKSYRIKAGSSTVSIAEGKNSLSNPKVFHLEVTYMHKCRSIVLDLSKDIPSMTNVIGGAAVSQTISAYTYTPNDLFAVSACGSSSVEIKSFGTFDASQIVSSSGMVVSLHSNDDSLAGTYYLQVYVSYSSFPGQSYRNDLDLIVTLKPSCRTDDLSAAQWIISGTSTVSLFDLALGSQRDNFYQPPIINTLTVNCPNIYSSVQEDSYDTVTSSWKNTWTDYTGAFTVFDIAQQKFTINTSSVTPAEYDSLDNATKHFRVVFATIEPVSAALKPRILDVYVRLLHPCRMTTLTSVTTIPDTEKSYYPAPYAGYKTVIPVENFVSAVGAACTGGTPPTQTMTVEAVTAIPIGTMADFISIAFNAVSSRWELTIAPTNIAQIGSTFTLKVKAMFVKYSEATPGYSNQFKVTVLPSCQTSLVLQAQWLPLGLTSLSRYKINLDGSATYLQAESKNNLAGCDFKYELFKKDAAATFQAFSQPQITASKVVTGVVSQTGLASVTLQSSNLALHNVVDDMKLRISLADNPNSSQELSFSVEWVDPCSPATVTSQKWSKSGTLALSAPLKVYLDNTPEVQGYEVQVDLAHCSIVTEIQVMSDTVADTYSTYTGSDIVYSFISESSYKITAQSNNLSYDRKVQKFRLSFKPSSPLSSPAADYLIFEVHWKHWCRKYVPTMLNSYPLQVNLLVDGEPVSLPAPVIIADGSPCNTYKTQPDISWPSPDRVRSFSNFTLNGAYFAQSKSPLDSGTYRIGVTFVNTVWDEASVSFGITVFVADCQVASIAPPMQSERIKIIHVLGSTNPTVMQLGRFAQSPECGVTLEFLALDQKGNALPQDMKITLDATPENNVAVVVDTKSTYYLGKHTIKIVGQYKLGGLKNAPDYWLDLELVQYVQSNSGNTPPEFLGVKNCQEMNLALTENVDPLSLNYTLPTTFDKEGDNVSTEVVLGAAEDYIQYFNMTRNFMLKENIKHVPSNSYKVKIILKDNNPNGSRSTECQLIISVLKTATSVVEVPQKEFLPPLEKYLVPKIEKIDVKGELTLRWSHDVARTDNMTLFEEQLKAEIETIDVFSGLPVKVPSFEVEFVDTWSELRREPVKLSWNVTGWDDDRSFKIQLTYDPVEAVSMEIPADYINITFWNQTLFVNSQENLYVERQLEITGRIPPQVRQGDAYQAIKAISTIMTVLIYASGAGGGIMSFFFGQALSMLWALLHALQLTVHLPIFSAQFPGFAFLFYESLIEISKIDLIDVGDTVSDLFALDPDEEPFSYQFELLQYESQNFLMNSGFIIVILVLAFCAVLLSFCLKALARVWAKATRVSNFVSRKLYWNFFLRQVVEMQLEFALIAVMDVYVQNWSNWGHVCSYVFALLAIASQLAFILALRFFVRPRYEALKLPQNVEKYGTFYEGLNIESNKNALLYSEWFFIRRQIFGITAMFVGENMWLTLQILFSCSVIQLIILGYVKPLESQFRNKLEMVNEVFQMLIQYHLITFTDVVSSAETRSRMGISCVLVTCFHISVNLAVMFSDICRKGELLLKRHFAKKRYKRLLLQRLAYYENKKMTIEELRKEIIKVEVKAKQHSYLLQEAEQPQQRVGPLVQPPLGQLIRPPPNTALFEGYSQQLHRNYRGFNFNVQMFGRDVQPVMTVDMMNALYRNERSEDDFELPDIDVSVNVRKSLPAFIDLDQFIDPSLLADQAKPEQENDERFESKKGKDHNNSDLDFL